MFYHRREIHVSRPADYLSCGYLMIVFHVERHIFGSVDIKFVCWLLYRDASHLTLLGSDMKEETRTFLPGGYMP